MYTLTASELEILKHGLSSSANLETFCRYWFDKGDANYFLFDRNFTAEGAWQKKLIFARQNLIVGVMGIGSGKTLGVGMAAYTWAMSTSDFKFMNGAGWAYQSKLMKELVEQQLVDTPAERYIENTVDTPYPKITLGFRVGHSRYKSTLEFMSMDKQAAKIFSWRGDWINLDEAALIEQLDVALMNLSTRLTGKTGRGREYLGRMSLMSNPWDNDSSVHLYYFYDLAIDSPEDCLSISIPTTANKNVSDRQVKNALKFIPDKDEQERLLQGLRPEGKGKYFQKSRVSECADPYLSSYIEGKVAKNEAGFVAHKAPTLGVVEYQMPRPSNHIFVFGDPGTGGFPARNAPCIVAVDTANMPAQPAVVVGFWWGNGGHAIQPFIDKLYEYREKYNPVFIGVDSTGPQAGMVQILNIQHLWDGTQMMNQPGYVSISGLDFSVGRKYQMLVSLRNMIELGLLHWADFAKGIKMQLAHYDPLMDRGGEPKIAQDIVATLSMAAFVIRAYYPTILAYPGEDITPAQNNLAVAYRNLRLAAEARNYRRGDPQSEGVSLTDTEL